MRKKLLLLSAFLLGTATIHAQTLTDVTSSYLQNAGFESDEAASSLESGTNDATSWTMANTNSSVSNTQYGVANSSTTIQGIGSTFTASEGNNYFYIRCNWQSGNTFTLSQDVKLPAGEYRISVKYATYDNTQTDPEYSLDVKEGDAAKGSNRLNVNTGAWNTTYLYVTKTTDENTALTISASMTQKSQNRSQHVALLLDDVKIESVGTVDLTDYSATTGYLVGTFEDCTAATASVSGSVSASETGATNGEWTYKTSATWSCSAVVAYGQSDVTVASVSAPATDNAGSTGNTLGVSVGWSGTELWQQTEAVTLPAGKYILTYYGYNNNTYTTIASKVGFVATDGTEYLSSKTSFAYGAWDMDCVTFTLNKETEGRFQVGGTAAHIGSGSNAKVFFDNLTLYRNATIAETETDELLALVPTGKMQATVQTALDEAKSALESDKTNFEKYCALAEAITAANTSIAAYATLNEALTTYAAKAENLDEAGQTAYDVSTIQTAYNEGTYDDAAAQAAAESVKATYVAAVKAQTTDGADFTDAIENPSFETGDATGWTYNSGNDTKVTVGNAGGTYGTDGIDGTYLFNTWQWSSNTLYIQQTVTSLPAGRYTLTTLVASDAGTAITVSAADQETNVTIAGAKTVFETATVTFLLTETTDVTIKVSTTSWLKTDNFQLTREGAAEESLTVTDAGMATYSSDYALDFSEVTGLTAYTATYDEGENLVTFHKVTGAVPAMTGLLLKANGSATVAVSACASADAVENNILVGNGSESVIVSASSSSAANFTLKKQNAGVNFVLVTEDHTLAANKAYAHIEADFVSDDSSVKALSFTFDDDAATAITTIATGSEAGKTGTYNMAGQRVGDNYKGIVIVNGKKILRK